MRYAQLAGTLKSMKVVHVLILFDHWHFLLSLVPKPPPLRMLACVADFQLRCCDFCTFCCVETGGGFVAMNACKQSKSFEVQGRQGTEGNVEGVRGVRRREADLHPGLLMQVCDVELSARRMGHQLVMLL